MAKEIHEQPEVISHTLANYLDMVDGTRQLPRPRHRSGEDHPRHDLGLRHGLLRRPRCASTGSSGSHACRSTSTSPPRCATARRRCLKAAWPFSFRSRARPPTRWRRCATARPTASASRRSSTSGLRRSRAKSHAVLPTLAGPEIGVASTKAFTCQLSVLACLAIAIGRARGS